MPELTETRNNEEIYSTKAKQRKGCLNHSVFEWITVLSTLFVPLVVGILTVVLPLQQQNLSDRQNENSQTIALHNRLKDMELLHDQQKQTILSTYEQDLCNLIFKYSSIINFNDTDNDGIDDDNDDERVSLIIRTKTLYALRQLDPVRKILLIQLLIDSGIQNRINLSHADLSSLTFPPGSFYNQLSFVNIIAQNLSLKRIHLYQSNFSYSILDGSSFQESNCSYADFSYASLQRTDWTHTDVTQVIFNYTNLLGAKITAQQLATVQSLHGATLPNGSIVAI
ncbi:unnamed protein product [Rotaria sp. Silwood1]|nr:unnamed protein product [Rotaria sp. Silwood1]CAF3372929.1 unnamed protein product [Rotaria sp. Silwood1]CAF3402302.1 unnamed protein product [Rotaria sp. Silwood1]CAF3408847.1 unnamed protein product [Rotaria sp. Silwood1]CAF4602575.1 unnamed protein product [Rotaria sp. Silwood1]